MEEADKRWLMTRIGVSVCFFLYQLCSPRQRAVNQQLLGPLLGAVICLICYVLPAFKDMLFVL